MLSRKVTFKWRSALVKVKGILYIKLVCITENKRQSTREPLYCIVLYCIACYMHDAFKRENYFTKHKQHLSFSYLAHCPKFHFEVTQFGGIFPRSVGSGTVSTRFELCLKGNDPQLEITIQNGHEDGQAKGTHNQHHKNKR